MYGGYPDNIVGSAAVLFATFDLILSLSKWQVPSLIAVLVVA
jgi:hypothetical protein